MSTIEVGKILPVTSQLDSVDVWHQYYNASEKEIKYVTFSYVPYNSVDDVVACNASGKTEVSGRLTGPIPPKHDSRVEWKGLWFNPTIRKVVVTKIHVQFMDNTEEVIEGKDVLTIDNQNSRYYRDITLVKAAKEELSKISDMNSAEKICSEVFLKFKGDEKTLMNMLSGLSANIDSGYYIGDYIEKKYSSDKEFIKVAVSIWKSTIAWQRRAYNTPAAIKHKGYPEIYASKIQKYEPSYVLPKEESNLIGKIVGKIMSIIVKK